MGFYTPKEVMYLMDNIKYGWYDDEGVFYSNLSSNNCSKYKLKNPKDIITRRAGICWDQVEVERFYLSIHDLNIKTFFMYYEDGINDESHTFLTYQIGNKFYWFEHAWEEYAGIREYNEMSSLLQDVKDKFISNLMVDNYRDEKIHCYIYEKPRVGLNVAEFYEFCKQGEKVDL